MTGLLLRARCLFASDRGALGLGPASAALIARLATLPSSIVASLAVTRLISDSYGAQGFAIYALIVTLPAMLPIADLGFGAAVTDALARRHIYGIDEYRSMIQSAVVVLACVGSLMAIVSIVLGVLGAWPVLLGVRSNEANVAASVAIAIFGIGLPSSLGYRVLLGLARNHVNVLIQGGSVLLTLASVSVLVVLSVPLPWIVSAPVVSQILAGALAWRIGRRSLAVEVPRVRGSRDRRSLRPLLSMALPMSIVSACLALAFQSDRVVLSHVSSTTELASYSLGAQIFTPALSVVSVAGLSLWPRYAGQRRADGKSDTKLREYVCIVAVFALAGLCIGLLLVWFGPFVGDIASGGVIVIGRDLMVAFAVLILVQSIHFPGGMFLTDVSGLRAQAVMSAVMLLINLPLSVLLARSLGAVGPVLGSAIAMVVAVLVPTAVLVVRRVDRVGSIQRSVVAGL